METLRDGILVAIRSNQFAGMSEGIFQAPAPVSRTEVSMEVEGPNQQRDIGISVIELFANHVTLDGYTEDSPQIQWLMQFIAVYSEHRTRNRHI
jgi:hypothetical protein